MSARKGCGYGCAAYWIVSCIGGLVLSLLVLSGAAISGMTPGEAPLLAIVSIVGIIVGVLYAIFVYYDRNSI